MMIVEKNVVKEISYTMRK